MKPLTYSGQARKWRIERRTELRYRKIVPCRVTRVYRVDLTAVDVPEWAVEEAARSSVLKLLSTGPRLVWLTRRSAKQLAEIDREAGGRPRLTEVEYCFCPVCGRILLGEDAVMRRRLNESCFTGRQLPCGGDCFARERKNLGKRAAA